MVTIHIKTDDFKIYIDARKFVDEIIYNGLEAWPTISPRYHGTYHIETMCSEEHATMIRLKFPETRVK